LPPGGGLQLVELRQVLEAKSTYNKIMWRGFCAARYLHKARNKGPTMNASAAFCGSVACRECDGRTAEIKLDFICA